MKKVRKQVAIKAKSKESVKNMLISSKPTDHSIKPVKCEFDPENHNYRFDTNFDNRKLGRIASWSTVYGTKPVYVKRLNGYVQGTCGKECGNKKDGCEAHCYVDKSYWQPSVVYGHARNTIGLRVNPEKVFKDLDLQLSRSKVIDKVRLNQSGEIENENEFLMWCKLAQKHPNVKFYIYTKQYKYVERALLAGMAPMNFQVNYSIWHKKGLAEFEKVKHLKNVSAFVYDDGETYIDIPKNNYCKAYDDNGKLDKTKSCAICGKCFNHLFKVIGCKDH